MTPTPSRPPTTKATAWIKSPTSSIMWPCRGHLCPITSEVSYFWSPHLHSSFSVTSIAGAKFERARRGRLHKDQYFLKPTDLLPREDPFRRKRALLGPGAAESRREDWFYQLDIDPLDEATNPRLLSYFVTDMGKMKSRADTKLTWRNQRRLTKAVRRAKMMGVIPILNKRVASYRRDSAL